MIAALGYQVTKLKRTRILDFTLKTLKPGALYMLKAKEAQAFQNALGLR